MKVSNLTLPAICLLLCQPAFSAAQENRRGPFAVNPNAISLTANTPTGGELRFNYAGDRVSPAPAPVFDPSYSGPDYRPEAMFPLHHSIVEIDGISTGNDLVPVNIAGEVDPMMAWTGMVFSVTNSSTGQPGGWVHRRVNLEGTTPGADLVSFVFEGSTGISRDIVGETFLEQSREHLGMSGHEDVDALDWFMLDIAANDGHTTSVFIVNTTEVYFSVTSTSAAALAAAGGFWGTSPASGATILKITWSESTQTWSTPLLVYTPTDLNLLNQDEVDAVAYNSQSSTLIFSTEYDANHPTRPQVMVTNSAIMASAPEGVLELKRATGASIPDGIKISASDDVDAVCGIDPLDYVFSRWNSTSASLGSTQSLGLSLSRCGTEQFPLTGTHARLQVTGLAPFSGNPNTQVRVLFRVGGSGSWNVLDNYAVGENENTVEALFPAPNSGGTPTLVDVEFRAKVLGVTPAANTRTGIHILSM